MQETQNKQSKQHVVQNNILDHIPNMEMKYTSLDPEFISNLNRLTSFSDEVLELAFGHLGRRLNTSLTKSDLSHPCFKDFFASIDVDKDASLNILLDAADIAQNVKDKGVQNRFLEFAVGQIEKTDRKNHLYSIIKQLSSPPVRSIIDAEYKEKKRQLKKPKVIEFTEALAVMGKITCLQQSDFSVFSVGYNFSDEVAKYQKSIDSMINHGLKELTQVGVKAIDTINNLTSERYYGFTRLKMSHAAIIAAKMHNFVFNRVSDYNNRRDMSVVVNSNTFNATQKFWGKDKNWMLYYQSRSYPIHIFDSNRPEKLQKIIDCLEAHPKFDNKPLFDYYWVICPSITLPKTDFYKNGKWDIAVPDCEDTIESTREFPSYALKLDRHLTKTNFITPIVLGEKDGKCYFICYWL